MAAARIRIPLREHSLNHLAMQRTLIKQKNLSLLPTSGPAVWLPVPARYGRGGTEPLSPRSYNIHYYNKITFNNFVVQLVKLTSSREERSNNYSSHLSVQIAEQNGDEETLQKYLQSTRLLELELRSENRTNIERVEGDLEIDFHKFCNN